MLIITTEPPNSPLFPRQFSRQNLGIPESHGTTLLLKVRKCTPLPLSPAVTSWVTSWGHAPILQKRGYKWLKPKHCNKWIFEDNAKGKLASRAEAKSLQLKIITACFTYLKELLEMGRVRRIRSPPFQISSPDPSTYSRWPAWELHSCAHTHTETHN